MLLAGCCTSIRLFPHEQVPPPSSGLVPNHAWGRQNFRGKCALGVQQEFPAFSAAHKWRVHSHGGYTGRPSSQLCKRFGKYCVYQSNSLALIATGLISLARSRVWVETQQTKIIKGLFSYPAFLNSNSGWSLWAYDKYQTLIFPTEWQMCLVKKG